MSLETDINALAAIPLFSTLDHEALRLIAFAAETRRMPPGEVLFRKGDLGEGGFLVISGSIALMRSEPDGAGAHSWVGPGVLIGEQALLARSYRDHTATVLEPASVMMISRALFSRVLREYPTNARAVRRFWARRLHEKLSKIKG